MAEVRTEESAAHEEVRASRFTLVDERGAVRATFGPGHDGTIGVLPASPRRSRMGAVALVLAGAVCAVVGVRLAPRLAPDRVSEPNLYAAPTGSTIRAEEIVLTDRDGAIRARLSVLADGTPLLWMSDPAGRSTAQLTVLLPHSEGRASQGPTAKNGAASAPAHRVAPRIFSR